MAGNSSPFLFCFPIHNLQLVLAKSLKERTNESTASFLSRVSATAYRAFLLPHDPLCHLTFHSLLRVTTVTAGVPWALFILQEPGKGKEDTYYFSYEITDEQDNDSGWRNS